MVSRLPVHNLDPASGTPGQVVVVDPTGTHFIIDDAPAPNPFGWFNVKDYGATGVAGSNPTAAFNAAIADLNASGRGVLYIPAGTYDTTGNLTPITVPCTIEGDGCANVYGTFAATLVTSSANNTPLLTVGGHATTTRGIAFKCIAGTTPVSGSAGVLVTGGDANRYEDCSFDGFYIDVDVQDGAEWYMEQCFMYDPVKYALKIRHIDLPDGGDQYIDGCQFIAVNHNADAAIRVESGGGLKLSGSKVNYRSSAKFAIGLDAAISAVTGVLTVVGNSFENITGACIKGTESGIGSFQAASIVANEFGYYGSGSYSAVDINGWDKVTVVGNIGLGISTATMIKLTNVNNGSVGLNGFAGFASQYTLTSCTGIVEAGVSTVAVKDEGTTIDSSVTSIDFVGSLIAATTDGSGHVTVTVTTPTSTSTGEVLMQDGVTSPPVPIETEAGDDWLYEG